MQGNLLNCVMRTNIESVMPRLSWPLCFVNIVRRCKRLSLDNLEMLISSGNLKRLKRELPGRLIHIPTQLITSEYAFSLAPEGWNYLRALVAEYEQHPYTSLEKTTFYRFFQHEQVRSVRNLNDVFFLHEPRKRSRRDGFQFYFGTYPWGHGTLSGSIRGGNPWGHDYDRLAGTMTRDLHGYRRNPWYLPGDRYALETEFHHTRELYHSLEKGYAPFWHGSCPTIILLVRHTGEWRAVRENGHHRLAILSQMNYNKVTVLIPTDSIGIVHENEVDQWYYVKRALCTPERALEIFHAYFELNGRERLDYLGLPCVY